MKTYYTGLFHIYFYLSGDENLLHGTFHIFFIFLVMKVYYTGLFHIFCIFLVMKTYSTVLFHIFCIVLVMKTYDTGFFHIFCNFLVMKTYYTELFHIFCIFLAMKTYYTGLFHIFRNWTVRETDSTLAMSRLVVLTPKPREAEMSGIGLVRSSWINNRTFLNGKMSRSACLWHQVLQLCSGREEWLRPTVFLYRFL